MKQVCKIYDKAFKAGVVQLVVKERTCQSSLESYK